MSYDTSKCAFAHPMRIGTITSANPMPLILTTLYWYKHASPHERNADVVFVLNCDNEDIVIFHDYVQGIIENNICYIFADNYRPKFEDYVLMSIKPTIDRNTTMSVRLVVPKVYNTKKKLRERALGKSQPNAPVNPMETPRAPVPASLYSSWVHPDIEDSLVSPGDYWLSNLDRSICEFLADSKINQTGPKP